MKDRFDIEQVIKILGLNIRADQADGGADFDVACNIARKKLLKIKEYEDLEEQGKLLKLPCAVGDSIYIILGTKEIEERKVVRFEMIANGWAVEVSDWFYLFDKFGKTVFLTREEAEAALQKIKSEESKNE